MVWRTDCESSINVVRTNKPKALTGLSQKGMWSVWGSPFPLSQTSVPPANRRLLTHPMVQQRNGVSPAFSLIGTARRKASPWSAG